MSRRRKDRREAPFVLANKGLPSSTERGFLLGLVWRAASVMSSPLRREGAIARRRVVESLRQFRCPRCRSRVLLCQRCDRGHVFCSPGCSRRARRESLRRAEARYRRSEKGRRNNAVRQKRFRIRVARRASATAPATFVTHHSPAVPAATQISATPEEGSALLACGMAAVPDPEEIADALSRSSRPSSRELSCTYCGWQSRFTRSGFLPRRWPTDRSFPAYARRER